MCVCIPEAGLGPLYPRELSFLLPSSVASTLYVCLRERERERERERKNSLRMGV